MFYPHSAGMKLNKKDDSWWFWLTTAASNGTKKLKIKEEFTENEKWFDPLLFSKISPSKCSKMSIFGGWGCVHT